MIWQSSIECAHHADITLNRIASYRSLVKYTSVDSPRHKHYPLNCLYPNERVCIVLLLYSADIVSIFA